MALIAQVVMIMCLNATLGNSGWVNGCCGKAQKSALQNNMKCYIRDAPKRR